MRLQECPARPERSKHAVTIAGMLLLLVAEANPLPGADDAAGLWDALANGGHVAIMRHALAPDSGDPADFELDDCNTQRNLNDAGRRQAQRTGQAFRDHDVRIARVMSSQWCRCLETARRLDLGPVEPLPALNSLFSTPEREIKQTEDLRRFIGTLERNEPSTVMITHQVNIRALTGEYTGSGEILVLKLRDDGGFELMGAVPPLTD